MNEPPPSDQEDFQHELDALRLILQQNLHKLKLDSNMGTQLEFWLESAKFLETDIRIWEDAGNNYKRGKAVERMRKVLDILQELIDRQNNHAGDGDG